MNPLPYIGLCYIEEHEVLVEVVEVPGVLLVEVVGELSLRVPLSGDALVVVHHAESIAVEDDTKDTIDSLCVTAAGRSCHDLAGGREGIVCARTLPEGNGLGIDDLGVLVMESVGLEEHVGGGSELREHDDVLEVFRGEPLLATLVEQSAHARETIGVEGDLVGGVSDELRLKNSLSSRQGLPVLGIVSGEEVDSAVGIGALGRLDDHVVDGAHNERVVTHRHGLLDLVEDHGDESVELGCAGEGLLHLHLSDGRLDLEGGHLVEELGLGDGLVEDMRIVGLTVNQIPAFILNSLRHLAGDLLNDGAELPCVHEDGRGRTAIGTVNENDLADMVDKGADIGVESIGVEDGSTNVNHVGKILVDNDGIADDFLDCIIYEFMYLFDFHNLISFV